MEKYIDKINIDKVKINKADGIHMSHNGDKKEMKIDRNVDRWIDKPIDR